MKKALFLLSFSFATGISLAQVKIGSTGNPNSNAVLELDGGTNKGFLLPRISNPQMLLLNAAPDGLMIYNTTDNSIYIRKIGVWRKITDALDGGNGLVLPYSGAASTADGLNVFKIQNTGAGNGINGEALGTGAGGFFNSVNGPALITGTGNVGIGTLNTYSPNFLLTPPQFPLDVSGRIRIRNYPGGSPGIWFDKVSNNPTALEQSAFFGVMNDSIVGLYGTKNGQWKFFMNHDNNNFGIYNSNPRAPLSFQAVVGNKLDFYYVSPTSMYGLGLGSGELQLYTADNTHHTSVGYGSNASFTETFRINNNGNNITTNPVALSAGVENASYFKTNNYYTGAVKTIGTSSAAARLALFTYADPGSNNLRERLSISDAGNVGIGNISPTRPLSFPPTLEKKISFYPGATGDAGVSVAGNDLRIHSDNANAIVSLGYDNFTNGFTENFRTEPNGNTVITNPAAPGSNVTAASYFRTGTSYTGAIKTIGTVFFGSRMGFFTGLAGSDRNALTEAMTIGQQGYVGINKTGPGSHLDVNGSVSFPVKMLNSSYNITDQDYSLHYEVTPGNNFNATITLPSPVNRAGRIYIISANMPYAVQGGGITVGSVVLIHNELGDNLLSESQALADPDGINWDRLINFKPTGLNKKKKLSLTVQSNGSKWIIIDNDFQF